MSEQPFKTEPTFEEFLLYHSGLMQGWANRLALEGANAIPKLMKDMQDASRRLRDLVEKMEVAN